MIRVVTLVLLCAGCVLCASCVDGIAPAEVGLGRRVGMFPGATPAVLPPLTDEVGNLYVATGVPDSTSVPQPGTAHSGGARGGWSEGCPTGTGARGGARGWVGALGGRGWLWTHDAIVELDAVTGGCITKLDTDPVSTSDLRFVAVAPLVDKTVSGTFAVAIATMGAQPQPYLVTLDLELGLVRASQAVGDVAVLATGADAGAREAAFLVRDGDALRIVVARAHDGIVAMIPVTGTATPGPLVGEIAFGGDGSVAAVVRSDVVGIGTRAGIALAAPPFSARTIERDDDGALWLAGSATATPLLAAITSGQLAAPIEWRCAMQIDAALAAGIAVLDERGGQRVAARWRVHGAYGESALLPQRSAGAYAVGARAILVADSSVDRGGIPYSQLAVIPVGVEFR